MYVPERAGEVVLAMTRDGYRPARWTGETGQYGEYYLLELLDSDKNIRLHYEDIKEA